MVNEPNASLLPTTNKQTEDDYELITTEDDERHHQLHLPPQPQQQHQHVIPGESIDVDDEDEDEQEKQQQQHDQDEIEDDEENSIVVEQIREQANVMVSNILAAAMHQINIISEEDIN